MRRFVAFIAVIAAAIAVVSTSASGAARNVTVEVDDDFFTPSSLTIKEDKTIDFNWVGEEDHNVYKKIGPGNEFDSGTHSEPGVNFSHKFKKPGKYVLGCILHDKMLMDLKVRKRRN
jgi:plastocyanin